MPILPPTLTRTRNLELLRSLSIIVDELKEYHDFEDYDLFWKLPSVATEIYDKVRITADKKKENKRLAEEKGTKSDLNAVQS